MERSIIIIGAGIAGLSAGCYDQMNGYEICNKCSVRAISRCVSERKVKDETR
jgi:thioredoxin reductase